MHKDSPAARRSRPKAWTPCGATPAASPLRTASPAWPSPCGAGRSPVCGKQIMELPDVIRRVLGRQLYATEVVYGDNRVVFAATDGQSSLKFTITVEPDNRTNPAEEPLKT